MWRFLYFSFLHYICIVMTRNMNSILPNLQAALKEQPIVKAWLFGSYSRGEEGPESDVDILVEYDPESNISLLTISRIMVSLSKAIGKKVDLVEEGRVLPFARENVERDKILIYERARQRQGEGPTHS